MVLWKVLNKSVAREYISYDLFHLYEISKIGNA